ncbi:MAG: RNA polymerase sigma factor [Burkholderiales bacterium]
MIESAQIVLVIPRLRRYARALTGERISADDLVQDTLERAWRKMHLFRTGTDLRAWLFTVMHNVYVNQVRTGRLAVVDGEDLAEIPERAGEADGLAMRDLDRAIACLPDEQREVLLLVALEDMTYDEAARALDVPIGTVMSRLSRAREKLRAMMQGLPAASKLHVVK